MYGVGVVNDSKEGIKAVAGELYVLNKSSDLLFPNSAISSILEELKIILMEMF